MKDKETKLAIAGRAAHWRVPKHCMLCEGRLYPRPYEHDPRRHRGQSEWQVCAGEHCGVCKGAAQKGEANQF